MAAKKKSHKRAPVLRCDVVTEKKKKRTDEPEERQLYSIEYRKLLPKGYFYWDDLSATADCFETTKRDKNWANLVLTHTPTRNAMQEQRKEATGKAANLLAKLRTDPDLKARKLRSLVKGAGVEFTR